MKKHLLIPAFAVLAALSGGLTLPSHQAAAQAASAPQPPAQPQQANRPPRPRPDHIEGRIAYLKAELKITPAQEAAWDKIAQALRQDDQEFRQAFGQGRANRGQPRSAVQRLEAQTKFAQLRVQQSERDLAALRPLYASLSDDQKKAADDLFEPHRHFPFRR
jgi:hypothetical protein